VRRRGACWAAAGGARQQSAPRQGACERGPRDAFTAGSEPGRGAAAGPAGRRGRWGGPRGGRPRRGRGRQPGGGPGAGPRCAAARRQKAARLQQPGCGSTQRIPAQWQPRSVRRRGQPSAEAHPAAGPREAAAGAGAAAGRARRTRDNRGGAHTKPLSQQARSVGLGCMRLSAGPLRTSLRSAGRNALDARLTAGGVAPADANTCRGVRACLAGACAERMRPR